jgi:hypothetical protein
MKALAIVIVMVIILVVVVVVVGVALEDRRSADGKDSVRGRRGRGGGRGRRHGGAGRRYGRGARPYQLNAGWYGHPYYGRSNYGYPYYGRSKNYGHPYYGRSNYGYPYYGYTPYLHDYAGVRPCPSDPTDGRSLCTGAEQRWAADDRCRAPGLAGDAEYVWRTGPEDEKCYSFNP